MTMSEGDGTNGAQRLTTHASQPQARKKFAIPPVKNACLSWYVATPKPLRHCFLPSPMLVEQRVARNKNHEQASKIKLPKQMRYRGRIC